MKIKLISGLLFTTLSALSQSHVLDYENKKLFKGEGIVFTQEYEPPLNLLSELFTPTEEDIFRAENIFLNRYDEDMKNVAWYKRNEDIKKKYWSYNRQYVGYINSIGEKIIIINLLNFKCKRKANKKFEGWKEFYFVGFGEFYEKNTVRFEVNLDKEKLKLR